MAALMLAAMLTAVLPAPSSAGQLLGGLLDQPLSNLLGALPRGTTRVIIRTDRGALASVLRLVLLLGGRVLAQHELIDALTVELPVLQLALVVRLPGVLSVSLDSPVASGPLVDIGPAESHLARPSDCRTAGCSAPRPTAAASASRSSTPGLAADRRLRDPPLRRLHQPANGKAYTENAAADRRLRTRHARRRPDCRQRRRLERHSIAASRRARRWSA